MVNNINSPTPTYTTSPQFESLPSSVQDTLVSAFTTSELNAKFPAGTISLSPPDIFSGSSADYFQTITETATDFSQQLAASEYIDQTKRGIASQAAALQALSLSDLFTLREAQEVADANQAAQLDLDFQQQLDSMATQTGTFATTIGTFNSGNAAESAQLQTIHTAYQTYLSQLNSIGSFNGNVFTINPGQQSQYNAFTATYQQAVSTFNSYLATREADISNFNNAVTNYNQTATQNNLNVQNTVTTYNLSSALANNNILNAQLIQPLASSRTDLYGGVFVTSPGQVIGSATTATIPNLPAGVTATFSQGVPSIGSVSYTAPDVSPIQNAFKQTLDNQNLAPINNAIQFKLIYFGYLSIQNIFATTNNIPDPILNFKPITSKVLPPTITNQEQQANQVSTQGGGFLAAKSIGLHNEHVLGMLGKIAFSKSIYESGLRLSEAQIEESVNGLAVLAGSLLGATSLQALFPALGPFLGSLNSLPSDSPAFAVLFAISFANRTQELVKSGLSEAALQSFLQSTGLKDLSASAQSELAAIFNLGLLLTSAKLLTTTAGASNLLQALVSSFLPDETAKALAADARQSSLSASLQLQADLNKFFRDQGIAEDEAAFLSNFGTQFAESQQTAPAITTITADALDQRALMDSIAASLILSQQRAVADTIKLTEAQSIAKEAVTQTLEEEATAHRTSSQFRADLEANLRLLGVAADQAVLASQEAVLVGPLASSQGGLSPSLFTGLPPTLTSLIQAEFSKTLFGTAASLAEAQTAQAEIAKEEAETFAQRHPSAIYNLIKDLLRHTRIQNDEIFASAVRESFKSTLETSTDFNKFIEKLMDPANSLIYSMQTGLMYGGHEPNYFKKSIDIVV